MKWDNLRTSYRTAHGPCADIRLYPGSAVDIRLIDRRANVRGQNAVSVLNCCASVDVTNNGVEFLQVAAVQNCWVAADGRPEYGAEFLQVAAVQN